MIRLLSRIGALTLLAALLALGWFGLAEPYRAWLAALDARNEASAALVERYRALQTVPAEPETGVNPLLLPELSEAQTTAFLQRLVQELAAASRVEIAGVQVLPGEDEAALRRVALRLRGSGEIAGINAFLHAIETASPLVVIDNLRLQGRSGPRDSRIEIQLDAIGFKAKAA